MISQLSLAIAASLGISSHAFAGTVTIRADEWCPFNCEPGEKPGYGIEIFTEAMKSAGHSVDYKVEPWARALEKTKMGMYNAVIGANSGEIKEFTLKSGAEPIGVSMDCVFTASDSKIKFTKPSDLGLFKRIGVINDYDYSEDVQKWIDDPKNSGRVDAVAGDDPVAINIKKLEGGRIDAMIEDRSVMSYALNQLALDKKITSAGCLKPAKLFIAFNPKDPESATHIKSLDTTITKLRKSGELAKILAKYGLKDWK